ncbi:MAG: ComEC/Rec2 family competence protein [Campylobacter sp.]
MHELFETRREIWLFSLICFVVFVINLGLKFYDFKQFKSQKHEILIAKVVQDYNKTSKQNKTYRVLKLQTDEFGFYTSTKNFSLQLQTGKFVKISVIKDRLGFNDFLSGSFYMPNMGIFPLRYHSQSGILNKIRDKFYKFITVQHQHSKTSELYAALFLATPISKELREDVNFYAVAHLIAISGYHVGLIFGFLYFIFSPIYRHFHVNFPYRNAKFDISVCIFAILLLYFAVIGFVPSFLRAILMSLVLFYLLSRNIKILNYELLFVVVLVAIALFPSLIFSIGFYFSCLGIFYIYLYLHHFSVQFSNLTNVILLNFWVFLAMILPVLYFFPLISFQQFCALPLTFLFVIFYPLSLILHTFEFGGLFDEYLLKFLSWRASGTNFPVPLWLFLLYNALSLVSVKSKILATVTVSLNLLCFLILL